MLRDPLQRYREKRDFSRTAEPAGAKRAARRTAGQRKFIIQKHAARRLHYDFRLEHNGVMLSWACPKGPSLDPSDKRLAVHVEDHPLEYNTFEGTIPKGQYGGGTVMLWDRGTWEPHGDVDEGLRAGKLSFTLDGERLQGGWALVRLRGRPGDRGRENWLLIKEHDEEARTRGKPLTDTAVTSIKTGRSMDEIARGNSVWNSNRGNGEDPPKKTAGKAKTAKAKKSAARTRGAAKKKSEDAHGPEKWLPVFGEGHAQKKNGPEKWLPVFGQGHAQKKSPQTSGKKGRNSKASRLPAFVAPQLATLVDAAPTESGWLHEIKYDGYRALASIGGGKVVIRTRKGLDWTDKFRPLVAPLAALPCASALLDGEITVADAQGRTSFSALQVALSEGTGGFGYYVFDLLHLDGDDLRRRPLNERKEMLAKLLARAPKRGPVIYSDHMQGEGAKVFRHACDLKLEGIISKRADDPYRSGRTASWLKVKCGMEQEFVIIGWKPSDKAGRPFSSILLAVREGGGLRYCGRVGTGYTEARLEDLAALFKKHARDSAPVPNIPRDVARHARFVEPVLVAEVSFRGWTHDGIVRQGSFKGLRTDKPAREVIRETPMPTAQVSHQSARRAGKSAARTRNDETAEFAGVRITHADRVLFKEQGVTKRELCEYYLSVADVMLPHVANRPLALVRCPQGHGKECFFQKHANPGWPDAFKKVRIKEKSGSQDYLYIEDERGLMAAVQMGVLELHLWGSHVDAVEQPDRMVFDFDPDEGLPFAKVKQAARDMRERLGALGLESFPMVTGGKGIHVVVPFVRRHDWDAHRAFAEAMARVMAEDEPERFVANMSKAKRRGKIFVDYLRNQRGATAIAPYSTRSRRGAYVAFPVSWDALGRLKDAHPANVESAAAKIARSKEPWPGYGDVRQALPLGKLKAQIGL